MTDHRKNICKFFKDQSKYVWSRIEFARQMNIRVSETSITEELLYRFYKAFWETDIPVRLFESVDENKNGSDIEILVNTNRGYILLACQAKITYKSSKYKSFYHKVKEVPQIDLLRDYAKRTGGIAQYLLYNFIPGGKMSKEVKILADIESYGITQVSADEIIEWMKEFDDVGTKLGVPGFNQFHPDKAFPFHGLICSCWKTMSHSKISFQLQEQIA